MINTIGKIFKKLNKLLVKELDKYSDAKKIDKRRKTKKQKIGMIISDIRIIDDTVQAPITEAIDHVDPDEDEESDFEVLETTHFYSDNSDSSDDGTVEVAPLRVSVQTRSGRQAKVFKLK